MLYWNRSISFGLKQLITPVLYQDGRNTSIYIPWTPHITSIRFILSLPVFIWYWKRIRTLPNLLSQFLAFSRGSLRPSSVSLLSWLIVIFLRIKLSARTTNLFLSLWMVKNTIPGVVISKLLSERGTCLGTLMVQIPGGQTWWAWSSVGSFLGAA